MVDTTSLRPFQHKLEGKATVYFQCCNHRIQIGFPAKEKLSCSGRAASQPIVFRALMTQDKTEARKNEASSGRPPQSVGYPPATEHHASELSRDSFRLPLSISDAGAKSPGMPENRHKNRGNRYREAGRLAHVATGRKV